MNIVMVAPTALACAPYEAMKCLNKYTDGRLDITLISAATSYRCGLSFPHDLLWPKHMDACICAINAADVIHVHNKFPVGLQRFCVGKPVIYQFHSSPIRDQFKQIIHQGYHCYSIAQPLQMREYQLPTLPNMIDPEEYVAIDKRMYDKPIILYAPTNRYPNNQVGSKGYETVMPILDTIQARAGAYVRVLENVPYGLNLAEKMEADIVIDDIIGQTWHRTSLEASCFSSVVVGSHAQPSWIYADANSLERVLNHLLDHPKLIHEYQLKSRRWIVHNYHPNMQISLYEKAYANALTHGRRV